MDNFGVYIHVPFCASRCGYCDFNTYTPTEVDTSHATYLEALGRELELAAASTELPEADTVFIGGGTPSLLGAEGLGRILGMVREHIGIRPGAEITTESNPESTSPAYFEGLLGHGFTRVSLGMQSASAPVLKVLDRRHTPGRATAAAREALAAGFEHVNLDMIYGTPTETEDDVRATLDAILGAGVDRYGNTTRARTIVFRLPVERRAKTTAERSEMLTWILTALVANHLNMDPRDLDPEFGW